MAQEKFVNRYSRLDRLLHRLAFASPGLQVSLADLEDQLNRKRLADIQVDRPVFITALPRAGTTILLNLLYETDEFATHTYRQMPFVLCPLIWQRLSGGRSSAGEEAMERAHGDGIAISVDSPEAFEEMIWHYFWPDNYRNDRIMPWRRQSHPEFETFFDRHVRKLILLADERARCRYVSKNNANIARLGLLPALYPDAVVIVLFREPVQHASSLLKQHRRFLATHAEDPFSSAYMRGIGHFDFGENLLPIDFDGWLDGDRREQAKELTFWLEYWVAAYAHVLRNAPDGVVFVSFDELVRNPAQSLQTLSTALGLEEAQRLIAQSGTLRAASQHSGDLAGSFGQLCDEAHKLYEQLCAKAVNASQ